MTSSETNSDRPLIAITMGDPAGVGPELALQAVAQPEVIACSRPLILGDANVLEAVAGQLGIPFPNQKILADEFDRRRLDDWIEPIIVDFHSIGIDDFAPGEVNAATGLSSVRYFDASITAALGRRIDAIVTGPIHKEAMHAAGVPFPGHTEMIADRVGTDRYCMMLTSEKISCGFVTTHVGLVDVPSLLSVERILETIVLMDAALSRLRGRPVRLCCCGLNPHAGESGLFGNQEEEKFIIPAVNAARERGILIEGPLPPDTAFLPTKRSEADGYVCMYHDQGSIPLKALAFDEAVNITLGLPIVRTSVDHGTACDIAWQGKACVSSLVEAVKLASRLAG